MRKRLLAVAVIAVVAIGLVVLRVPSGSAASTLRYTPGQVVITDDTSITFSATNMSSKSVVVTFRVTGGGFTAPTSSAQAVDPTFTGNFVATCASGPCFAVPIVEGPKKLAPSVHYKPSGSADFVGISSGAWTIFK